MGLFRMQSCADGGLEGWNHGIIHSLNYYGLSAYYETVSNKQTKFINNDI